MVFDTPWVYYDRSGRLGMAGVGWRHVMAGWTSDGVLMVWHFASRYQGHSVRRFRLAGTVTNS
jgi:hypothetical protein